MPEPHKHGIHTWRENACLWAMHPGTQRLYTLAAKPEAYLILDEPEPIEPYIVEAAPALTPLSAVRLPQAKGSVAVLPIVGPIGQNRRVDWASVYADELQAQVLNLAANPSVGAIVLDINSPGGIVYGTPELAATIYSVRQTKPIYGVAAGMAASAAYWIGSQVTKLFAAPSAEVGSIGVWSGHVDLSRQLERFGIKVTLIAAGEYKVEGNPYEPLTDEARADMQQGVDSYYADFLTDVARGRNTSVEDVRENFGKGRMIRVDKAKQKRMIDGVATLMEVVSTISSGSRQRSAAHHILDRLGLAKQPPVEGNGEAGESTDSEATDEQPAVN